MRYILIIFAFVLAGCHEPPLPPSEDDIARTTEGQPQLFVVESGPERVTLEGLEGFYLGMSEADAMTEIKTFCKRPVELKGGVGREQSEFRGCLTPDHEELYAFRIGFNKTISNRVFTLETKRRPVDLKVVRARFYERFADVKVDLPKRGTLRMETAKLNLFADIDDGKSGPTHILLGLTDAEVAKLK